MLTGGLAEKKNRFKVCVYDLYFEIRISVPLFMEIKKV